jgi:SAM-dependent methyltransferase
VQDVRRNSDAVAESVRALGVKLEREISSVRRSLAVGPVAAQAEGPDADVSVPVPDQAAPGGPPRFDYVRFEEYYRGSVEDIRGRQRYYLPWFAACRRVVDLGCGRGEFVELLAGNGIPVTGVDRNPEMVRVCTGRGLSVVEGGIVEYLGATPVGGVDGIFSAQVVEHMGPDQIIELVALCQRAMTPGGVIAIETVNPDCDTAMRNFYLDPTHIRPVPARMLRFILESAGFQVEAMVFSAPCPGVVAEPHLSVREGWPDAVRLYQDYAVIAHRV